MTRLPCHRFILCLPMLVTAMVLSGCGNQEENSTIEGLKIDFDVRDKFGADAAIFSAGDEIRFVFTVSNDTSSEKRLSYTHPAHSLQVRRVSDGQLVWDPHHGQVFPQVITTIELAAGDELVFVESWDMQATPELASSVPPGEYDAEPGFFMFDADGSGDLRLDEDDEIRFTIQ